jgi:acyl-CoA dehydrogenase
VLLRDSVRDFLASRWPATQAVELSGDAQAIAALWRDMSAQGLTSLGSDPAQGGLREIVLVFEELGRASCPAPLLGAVSANLAGLLLDDIREGKALPAAAYGAFDGDAAAGRVERNLDGTLTGRMSFVEGAAVATHFMVLIDAPAGSALVAAGAPGLSVMETPGLAVPAFSELSFLDTPARFVELEAGAITDIALVARIACAARALGAAQRAFELAVEHAKVPPVRPVHRPVQAIRWL